jgi:hypothetical protein
MANMHAPQRAKHARDKDDRVQEMAARLFAELFYRQYVAEREQKRRQGRGKGWSLTAGPKKV